MRTGTYNVEEDKLIQEMRNAGKSNHEIALKLDRSLDSIKGRVKLLMANQQIQPRKVNSKRNTRGKKIKRWTPNDIKKLKELRKTGEPYSTIAAKLNRTPDSVQQMCIRLMQEDDSLQRRNSPRDSRTYNLNSEIAKIGLMLWWAEGTKKGRNVQFVNSSPDMIRVYILFLRDIGVDMSRLSAKVKVMNSSQVSKSQGYWSRVTGISLKNFTRPIIRGKKTEERYKKHKGCVTITYCSANLKRQMETRIAEIVQELYHHRDHVSYHESRGYRRQRG